MSFIKRFSFSRKEKNLKEVSMQLKADDFSSLTDIVEAEKGSSSDTSSWSDRIKKGLRRSSKNLTHSLNQLFSQEKLDDQTLEKLEDIFIQSDFGVDVSSQLIKEISKKRYKKNLSLDELYTLLSNEIVQILAPISSPLQLDLSFKPNVILVVGVNGSGKTTTIGKLATKLRNENLKVTLAAGDTFRAAAIDQLRIWSERSGSDFVASEVGSDSASIVYKAYKHALQSQSDVLIIDTAGRMQNRSDLMDELKKIVRVLKKNTLNTSHTVIQTLDATTGQNALKQVEVFTEIAGVTGLVLNKLDGTAKGGILIAIAKKFNLPVYFIGTGEKVEDLTTFTADDFTKAIFKRD